MVYYDHEKPSSRLAALIAKGAVLASQETEVLTIRTRPFQMEMVGIRLQRAESNAVSSHDLAPLE